MTNSKQDRPLDGWRILVPRGGPWGDGVAASLRSRGAVPVSYTHLTLPTIYSV